MGAYKTKAIQEDLGIFKLSLSEPYVTKIF